MPRRRVGGMDAPEISREEGGGCICFKVNHFKMGILSSLNLGTKIHSHLNMDKWKKASSYGEVV